MVNRAIVISIHQDSQDRASKGVEFSRSTFVDPYGYGQKKGMLELKAHVAHMEYRFDYKALGWDDIFGEGRSEKE